MKLCNHRHPRNGPGTCVLRANDISKVPWSYLSHFVFAKEGQTPSYHPFWGDYQCTERMSSVCPYRSHTPRPKKEKCIWYQCPYCDGRHRTEQARLICKSYKEWRSAMNECIDFVGEVPWASEGTREEIYAPDVLEFKGFENVRAHIWPWMQAKIVARDKRTCQDCGIKDGEKDSEDRYVTFEVHHIIPRGLGGSDHPKNLKLVCKQCHQKYNDKFNGYIKKVKRAKAQDLDGFDTDVTPHPHPPAEKHSQIGKSSGQSGCP